MATYETLLAWAFFLLVLILNDLGALRALHDYLYSFSLELYFPFYLQYLIEFIKPVSKLILSSQLRFESDSSIIECFYDV